MRSKLVAIGMAMALAVAGCGDDDESSEATPGEGTSGPTESADGAASAVTDVESARELVERFSEPVTSVGVTEPVSRAPEPGREIVFLECPVPTCAVFGDGIEAAADLLGWELHFNWGFSGGGASFGWEDEVFLVR